MTCVVWGEKAHVFYVNGVLNGFFFLEYEKTGRGGSFSLRARVVATGVDVATRSTRVVVARRAMRRRRARSSDAAWTIARAGVVVATVALTMAMRCEAAGAPVAPRATSREVSSAIRAALDAPCDAYARTFEGESVGALRAGLVEARRVACESAGLASRDACERRDALAASVGTMTREAALDEFRLAMHEACQSGAAAMSDPEKRDASEATRFVREAVSRAASEEVTAGRKRPVKSVHSSPSAVVDDVVDVDVAKGERGMWGWDRETPTKLSPSEAFGEGASVDAIKHQESVALRDIYRRTNGARWRRRDGWMSDASYCRWYGVTCQEEDHGVTFIDLRDNEMEGDMPQAIDELKMLQGLDLSYNRLEGRLSAMIGELKSLRYLLVRSNALYSDIPAGLFRKRSALTKLDLSDNALTGKIPAHEFTHLTNLRMFNVSSNMLTGEIPAVRVLPALEVFSASTNRLRGVVPTFDYTANIRFFDVSKNVLHGPVPQLSQRVPWILFDVSGNELSGELPTTALPAGLRVFSVGDNNLNGTIPRNFGRLKSVEHLDFSSNSFVGEIPSDIFRKLPLKHFNASRNALEGELPRNLYQGERERAAMRLEDFDVSHNRLTGEIPSQLVTLDNLRVFDVSHNNLRGALPERWSVARLERLDAKANALEGAIPTALARARRLRHLDLSLNKLTSHAHLGVLTIPTLEHLDVSGNALDWSADDGAARRPRRVDHARAIRPPSDEL